MPVRLLRRLTVTALSGRHSVARREATTPGCRQQPRASGRKGSHVPAKKSTTSPRGQAEATAKGRSKVFRSERARKRKQKGENKVPQLRESRVQKDIPSRVSEGKAMKGESVYQRERKEGDNEKGSRA